MRDPLSNLRHLAMFLEAGRAGSISAAARRGHLSQPAVTQAVAAVEAWLGGQLLRRGPSGLKPTAAGEAAARRIERALGHLLEGLSGPRGRSREHRADALRGIGASQLLAFAEVAGAGGFAAAAAQAARTRAAMHRAVRSLERELGCPLLDGATGRLLPTREGERLEQGVRLAMAELAQARDEVAQSLGRPGGRTVIGAMPLARSALVPRAVLAFAAGHPAHAVGILEGPYETLLAALRSGRADILVGALRDSPAADVVQEHLFEDPLALIVRMGHPLAGAGRAPSLADLAGFAWIAPRAESPLRRQFDLLSRQLGQRAVAAPIECNSLSAARALLLGSDRIMLLSEHQVHHELASAQLLALPHPLGPLSRAIGLTRRRNWHPTAAQARLLEVLREQCQRIGSGGAAVADTRVIQRAGMPAAPSRARKARGERRLARVKKRLK